MRFQNTTRAMPDNNDTDTKDESPSLADRVRSVRDTLKRKEKAIRAKRRAKAWKERRSEPGLGEELSNLADDVGELASTATGPVTEPAGDEDDTEGGLDVGAVDDEILDPFESDPLAETDTNDTNDTTN